MSAFLICKGATDLPLAVCLVIVINIYSLIIQIFCELQGTKAITEGNINIGKKHSESTINLQ